MLLMYRVQLPMNEVCMENKKAPQLKIIVQSKTQAKNNKRKNREKLEAAAPASDPQQVLIVSPQLEDSLESVKIRELTTVQLLKQRWVQYYPSHRHQLWYAAAGFLFACAWLYLGIFKVLLISICTLAGMIYGRSRDRERSLRAYITSILEDYRL